MPRPYRLQGENCFYHIISRGDNRKKIFLDGYDFKKFLDYVVISKNKYRFNLYAYCLMPNHYHLFLEILQPNLSRIMQYINTAYSAYYNKKRNTTGHVFQGRFKSIMVDEDNYFLVLTRYIHLNPVKAKLVNYPQDYKWSSFRGYIKKNMDEYIDYPELYNHLGLKPADYKKFVLDSIDKEDNLRDKVYAGIFLGGKGFIKDKIDRLKPAIDSGDFAYKREVRSSVSIEEVLTAAKDILGKDRPDIIGKKKSQSIIRKAVIYIIRRITPLTNKQIGYHFNVSDSAIGKIDRKVEELLKKDGGLKKKIDEVFSIFRV